MTLVCETQKEKDFWKEIQIPPESMAFLHVDLEALRRNYDVLRRLLSRGRCGAVLKADAYSMGLGPVARTLEKAGCQDFFVAHGEEGLALRKILPQARIYVFSGLLPQTEELFREARLIPVLGDGAQLEKWARFSLTQGEGVLPAMIYLDTGMARNGLDRQDIERLKERPEILSHFSLAGYLSHLACAEEATHEMNNRQLNRLKEILKGLPSAPVSLVNSAGILLGPDYHYDLARPGQALYGLQPGTGMTLPLHPVASFYGRVVQIAHVPGGTAVGYGGTYVTPGPSRLATLGVGYGDGYKRLLSREGWVYGSGYRMPVVGRVSMDYITVDITPVPEDHIRTGQFMELLGPHVSIEEMASQAGTIPHDILVGLGPRCHRIYSEA